MYPAAWKCYQRALCYLKTLSVALRRAKPADELYALLILKPKVIYMECSTIFRVGTNCSLRESIRSMRTYFKGKLDFAVICIGKMTDYLIQVYLSTIALLHHLITFLGVARRTKYLTVFDSSLPTTAPWNNMISLPIIPFTTPHILQIPLSRR